MGRPAHGGIRTRRGQVMEGRGRSGYSSLIRDRISRLRTNSLQRSSRPPISRSHRPGRDRPRRGLARAPRPADRRMRHPGVRALARQRRIRSLRLGSRRGSAAVQRIIPVLWRAVDFSRLPDDLGAINAVPFDGERAVNRRRSSLPRSTATSTGCASTPGWANAPWNGNSRIVPGLPLARPGAGLGA